MNTTPTTPPPLDPRAEASRLVNLFATKTATLNASTADVRAELAVVTAKLNEIEAPHKAELAIIKSQAEALALKHPEIFGKKRSFAENGYKLGLTATEEVDMDAPEETVCRVILRELREVELKIATAEAAADPVKVQELTYQRLALSSVLTTKHSINKAYVKSNAETNEEWFEFFGIRVVQGNSASLKEAPPPSEAKGGTKQSMPKLKTAAQPTAEKEAA